MPFRAIRKYLLGDITDITASPDELNILDGVTADKDEINKLDGATLSTDELNILDGVTADKDEINKLDGVTATTAEINILDRELTTLVDGDTTPDISGGDLFVTANTGATTITGFDNAPVGLFAIIIGDANTTIQHSATLVMMGEEDATPPSGARLLFLNNGTTIYELSRNS